jgi:neprilysin
MWRTAAAATDTLNKAVRNRHLEFSKVLSGKLSFELRWQECVDVALENFPIAVSALYVKNFFKKESKQVALEMVDAINEEFQKILQEVSWMDDTTRTAAVEKAKKMIAHIGYPDELMDDKKLIEYYNNLTISEGKYFESILNISKFDSKKTMENFRKLVNKTDWETHSSVAVINAFYNPLENSIRKYIRSMRVLISLSLSFKSEFPAGILQGAFFNANRPRYMNYGAIGSVIGHEITHGLDDEGSQFDSDGNLVDWWKEDTKVAYLEKAKCIIEQYGNYTEPNVDLNLNGINTQGENIADNGGIKEAYFAYKSYTQKKGEELKLPNLNYTAIQLFWIAAAQSWCSVSRPGWLIKKLMSFSC